MRLSPAAARLWRPIAIGIGVVVLAQCSSSTSPGPKTVASYVAGVTTLNGVISATQHAGTAPAASGGPALNVSGGASVINGGSAQVTLAAADTFRNVFVSINGVDGYWQLTLASAADTTALILTFNTHIPDSVFTFLYNVGNGSGSVSATVNDTAHVHPAGSGDVQVSVSWDSATDVDLHLVQPDSQEIYYGNRTSSQGGTLDLDSNAACSLDYVNNENITYPSSTPPHGTYTVRVDYWSACTDSLSTHYVVTVRVKGQATKTYTGTFIPANADAGGSGSGRTITTFSY